MIATISYICYKLNTRSGNGKGNSKSNRSTSQIILIVLMITSSVIFLTNGMKMLLKPSTNAHMYSRFISILNILCFINCIVSHLRDIYLAEHFNHRVLDTFSKTITVQLIISLVLFLYLPTRSTHNNNHINYIFQHCCNKTSNLYENTINNSSSISDFCSIYNEPYECDDYDIFYEHFCQKIRYRIYIMIISTLVSLIANHNYSRITYWKLYNEGKIVRQISEYKESDNNDLNNEIHEEIMNDLFGEEKEDDDNEKGKEKTEKNKRYTTTKYQPTVEAVIHMTLKTVKKYQNRLLIGLLLCLLYQIIYTIMILRKHSVYGYDLISHQFCVYSVIYTLINTTSFIYVVKYERKMLCVSRDDVSLLFSLLPILMMLLLIIINTIPLSFHYTETFRKCCRDSEISLNCKYLKQPQVCVNGVKFMEFSSLFRYKFIAFLVCIVYAIIYYFYDALLTSELIFEGKVSQDKYVNYNPRIVDRLNSECGL